MGIDGINRPSAGVSGVAGSEAPAAPEELVEAKETTGADPTTGSSALGALERGELSLEQYLDQRVTEAVQHLDGAVPPEQLSFIRETLRDQLTTDPALLELVRRATGATP